jgi:hypothetical protein
MNGRVALVTGGGQAVAERSAKTEAERRGDYRRARRPVVGDRGILVSR